MRRARRSGYILLLVLVTLAITSLALAATARSHLRQIGAANEAERELKTRWAGITLRETLLPQARLIMRDLERQQGHPVPVVRATFILNEQPYQIVLSDEQAKLNVNAVYAWGGYDAVHEAIDRLTQNERGIGPRPRIIVPPATAVANSSGWQPVFASYAQVFDDADPSVLFPAADGRSPVERVTCWGFGRVNFRRASEPVLREAVRSLLSREKVAELVRLRDEQAAPTVEALLIGVGERNPRMSPLSQRLIEESWCHSLWIATRFKGQMSYDLSVRDDSPDNGAATYRFSWNP